MIPYQLITSDGTYSVQCSSLAVSIPTIDQPSLTKMLRYLGESMVLVQLHARWPWIDSALGYSAITTVVSPGHRFRQGGCAWRRGELHESGSHVPGAAVARLHPLAETHRPQRRSVLSHAEPGAAAAWVVKDGEGCWFNVDQLGSQLGINLECLLLMNCSLNLGVELVESSVLGSVTHAVQSFGFGLISGRMINFQAEIQGEQGRIYPTKIR